MNQDVKYPIVNEHLPEITSFGLLPPAQVSKLMRGEDPKSDFIPYCNLMCKGLGDAYAECERARKDPTLQQKSTTCLYLYREYLECVEGCVQPKVVNNLYGTNARYHFYF